MPRKTSLLKKHLSNLTEKRFKKIKNVIGMLVGPKDFLTILTVLDGQDKNIPDTIHFYEALFRRFGLNSHLVDGYMTKEEWHNWTVVLLELSNVLWKFREKFEPCMWLETNKRIYEITFKILKSFDSEKRSHKECKPCSTLFSVILSNFTSYREEGDIEKLKIPSVDTLKWICEKNVGRSWYYLTCGNLIEQIINT